MERGDNRKRGRPFGPVDGSTSGRSSPHSLSRTISPPRKKCRQTEPDGEAETRAETRAGPGTEIVSNEAAVLGETEALTLIPSPFRLTHIRDLDAQANVDTVTLQDIIGDPLISECWNFNYLHNVDFLMNAFDDDTRCLVKVHIVHGFWRKDDTRRLVLYEDASRYQNVTLHSAFIPEIFGTHHSKMLILLRHDDTAQVVIHTANMIPKDWTNMAQGVWLSPRLPLLSSRGAAHDENSAAEGSGQKFKLDLLSYLRAYDVPRITCRPLIRELEKYDFSAIRGTLIASVPGRHPAPPRGDGRSNSSSTSCYWGWTAMKKALQSVPIQPQRQDDGKPEVVIQISSIATLGPTDVWLRQTLFDALSGGKKADPPDTTIFENLGRSADKPEFKVVFPTPDEIRRSLDGYGSGGSIHTKIESPQQAKQLLYLKPMFCHWAHDAPRGEKLADDALVQDAGRKRAAPHIKTYIRYDGRAKSPEWALLTSANLSKQAWGEAMNPAKEVRIASWEIGVLVWPALYDNDARMTTVFGTDAPSKAVEEDSRLEETPVVGLRVPYNLPLQRYGKDEVPWVATSSYKEPDWIGNTWDP